MKFKARIKLQIEMENICQAPDKETASRMIAEYLDELAFRSNKLIELESNGAEITSNIKLQPMEELHD